LIGMAVALYLAALFFILRLAQWLGGPRR